MNRELSVAECDAFVAWRKALLYRPADPIEQVVIGQERQYAFDALVKAVRESAAQPAESEGT